VLGTFGAIGGAWAVPLTCRQLADARRRFGAADPVMTRNLLAALSGGTVRHLLYVSIVGIDRIPFRYYRHKLECERVVAASGLPYTLFRATQFHELAAWFFDRPVAALPLGWKAQPVAAREAAERAAELMAGEPAGGVVEFGGPEVLTARELVRTWRAARGRPMVVVPLPTFGALARGFRAGHNTTPEHAEGRLTWAEFAAI
jgi:uncharacterized protein YbjT (DUF2867 family)